MQSKQFQKQGSTPQMPEWKPDMTPAQMYEFSDDLKKALMFEIFGPKLEEVEPEKKEGWTCLTPRHVLEPRPSDAYSLKTKSVSSLGEIMDAGGYDAMSFSSFGENET